MFSMIQDLKLDTPDIDEIADLYININDLFTHSFVKFYVLPNQRDFNVKIRKTKLNLKCNQS